MSVNSCEGHYRAIYVYLCIYVATITSITSNRNRLVDGHESNIGLTCRKREAFGMWKEKDRSFQCVHITRLY